MEDMKDDLIHVLLARVFAHTYVLRARTHTHTLINPLACLCVYVCLYVCVCVPTCVRVCVCALDCMCV